MTTKEQFLKECEELFDNKYAQKEKVSGKRWTPNLDNEYYFICSNGSVGSSYWNGFSFDRELYKFGNCYKTEEEAQKALDKQLLLVELQDFADEVNDSWVPDWNDENEAKYSIGFSHTYNKFGINRWCEKQFLDQIYFETSDLAEQAINHFGDRLTLLMN